MSVYIYYMVDFCYVTKLVSKQWKVETSGHYIATCDGENCVNECYVSGGVEESAGHGVSIIHFCKRSHQTQPCMFTLLFQCTVCRQVASWA